MTIENPHTIENDRSYLDYVRDAQALRARYLNELMTNAYRSITALLRLGFRSRVTRGRLA